MQREIAHGFQNRSPDRRDSKIDFITDGRVRWDRANYWGTSLRIVANLCEGLRLLNGVGPTIGILFVWLITCSLGFVCELNCSFGLFC